MSTDVIQFRALPVYWLLRVHTFHPRTAQSDMVDSVLICMCRSAKNKYASYKLNIAPMISLQLSHCSPRNARVAFLTAVDKSHVTLTECRLLRSGNSPYRRCPLHPLTPSPPHPLGTHLSDPRTFAASHRKRPCTDARSCKQRCMPGS